MSFIPFFGLLFVLIVFMLHIASCVFVYRDCIKKRRSPEFALLAVLAVLFFPVMGLVVYLIIRNYSNSRY